MDFLHELEEHQAMMSDLRAVAPALEGIAQTMTTRLGAGGTVYWFGNGGSAAQAQHLAAELVGRYERERPGLPSLALTTDTSVLTAVANDYAFDDVFARQVRALCTAADVVVGLSTSGSSRNVLLGLEAAHERQAFTVALTGGDGGPIAKQADASVVVRSTRTSRIQEAHLFLGHLLCGQVEAAQPEGGS